MQRICGLNHKERKTNSRNMGNRICNQETGGYTNTKQSTKTYGVRGYIGDRSNNLIKLIGAERVSRRDFKYVGTFYVTEDGEIYDKEYVTFRKVQRTGVSFYEVIDWEYIERKKQYKPTIRRIVMIKDDNTQLSLSL